MPANQQFSILSCFFHTTWKQERLSWSQFRRWELWILDSAKMLPASTFRPEDGFDIFLSQTLKGEGGFANFIFLLVIDPWHSNAPAKIMYIQTGLYPHIKHSLRVSLVLHKHEHAYSITFTLLYLLPGVSSATGLRWKCRGHSPLPFTQSSSPDISR